MFGTTNIRRASASGSRSRSSSKVAAYYAARAMDEALGGALHRYAVPCMNGRDHRLLFVETAARYWDMQGMTEDAGRNGAFNLSDREFRMIAGKEEKKARGDEAAIVQRGPDAQFPEMVKAEHKRLSNMIELGEIPANMFRRLRFWNEQPTQGHFREDVPNPNRAEEIGEDAQRILSKKTDTVAVIEQVNEITDDMRENVLAFLSENLIDLSKWKYRVPIDLFTDHYEDATE